MYDETSYYCRATRLVSAVASLTTQLDAVCRFTRHTLDTDVNRDYESSTTNTETTDPVMPAAAAAALSRLAPNDVVHDAASRD